MTTAFTTRARAFLKSDDGPTATDHALMLAPTIVVVIVSVSDFGAAFHLRPPHGIGFVAEFRRITALEALFA